MRALMFLFLLGAALLPAAITVGARQSTVCPPGAEACVMPMNDVLRLRAGPSTQAPVLTELISLAPLHITRRTEDSAWFEVHTSDGTVGWVAAPYVQPALDLDDVSILDPRATTGYGITLGPRVADAVRIIADIGRILGNRPDVFAKVGDSITVSTHMLYPFSEGRYDLADFTYLQPVIDHFMGGWTGESDPFSASSRAAGVGWNSSTLLDPDYADPATCNPGEPPLLCEYRRLRPSIALIMIGTNDIGLLPLDSYRRHLDRILDLSIEAGVIPIVSTLPLRRGRAAETAAFNAQVIESARAHRVPLWDYAAALQPLPDQGLNVDGVHPSIGPRGYKGEADFRSHNLQYGYVLRNLTALQMLDAVLRAMEAAPTSDNGHAARDGHTDNGSRSSS